MPTSSYDDPVAILALTNDDPEARTHSVPTDSTATFTWAYDKGSHPRLDRIYEKAKTGQWNVSTDLDWSTEVDPERVAALTLATRPGRSSGLFDGTPAARWTHEEWVKFSIESQCWTLSQFLHGEQGALLCAAKLTEVAPDFDAKLVASTQVVDEARHTEAFSRYLSQKLPSSYPVNPHLRAILDDALSDSRWDVTYLMLQVLVEGLALAAFGYMRQFSPEPLLCELLRLVMSDESRHVAFGVLSLQEAYASMTEAELAERAELAFEGALHMRNRFLQQEVWERLGLDPALVIGRLAADEGQREFRHLLFTKIVPNCAKLGLLDVRNGWLRERFAEIGVAHYAELEDTSSEYERIQLDTLTPAGVAAS